jgi:hypothetical protein
MRPHQIAAPLDLGMKPPRGTRPRLQQSGLFAAKAPRALISRRLGNAVGKSVKIAEKRKNNENFSSHDISLPLTVLATKMRLFYPI